MTIRGGGDTQTVPAVMKKIELELTGGGDTKTSHLVEFPQLHVQVVVLCVHDDIP